MTKFYLSLSRYVTVLLMMATTVAWSQGRTVTGKVTASDDGSTMPGVNIVVKGTAIGTTTDVEGRYSINVEGNATLIFTFVGYGTQEVAVGEKSEVNVVLQSDVTALSEVVVEGYATIKKKDLTGAVAQVSSKDLNKGIYTSPAQLLQGKLSGVLVVGATGAPGAETAIQIRGVSSVTSGTAPLIVVDGIQLDNQSGKIGFTLPGGLGNAPGIDPLSFINSADIDRIDVLKDASALAIYGSRGANGVIMITTKKAPEGTLKLDFNASAGVSTISKKIKVLNGDEYRAALVSENGEEATDFGDNVNAFDKIIQTGTVQNYNIGLSAGGKSNSHRFSVGYTDQKGIIKNSGMTKYNALLKSNYNLLDDRIKFDVLLLGAHIEQESAPIGNTSPTNGNLISQALQWNPTKPLYNDDGTINQPSSNVEINPMATLAAYENIFQMNRLLASVAPSVRLAKGLDYRLQIAVDHSSSNWYVSQKKLLFENSAPGPGRLETSDVSITNQQYSHTLSYTTTISDIELLGYIGYEYQRSRLTGITAGGFGFSSDLLDFKHSLQNIPAGNLHVGSIAPPDAKLQSFFGRVQVNFKEKLKVTGTLRNDGSSKFSPSYRHAYFPAIAAAWSLDEHNFLPESVNDLKLRLSWGKNGNQSFPSGLSGESFYFIQGGGENQVGQAEFGAPGLKWETSVTSNIGVDFGFFNSKVTGSIDAYNKKTNDLLFYLDAAAPFVGAKIWSNIKDAYIVNKGIELGLNSYLIDKDKMSLQLGLNFTYRTIKFEPEGGARQLGVLTGVLNGNGLTDQVSQKSTVGGSLNEWFMPTFQGFDENGNSIYKAPDATHKDGQYQQGTPYAKFLGGLTLNFNYGKFDASLSMNGSAGNKVYNNTANAIFVKGNLLTGRNVSPDLVGNGESVSNRLTYSTRYLEKGDFLRLSNVSAGYTFDLDTRVLKTFRIYATAQNLFVITKYSGFDPEVNVDKSQFNVSSFGVDYTQYPRARTFSLGISASL